MMDDFVHLFDSQTVKVLAGHGESGVEDANGAR